MNNIEKFIPKLIVILIIIILIVAVIIFNISKNSSNNGSNTDEQLDSSNVDNEESWQDVITEEPLDPDEYDVSVNKNTDWNLYTSIEDIMETILDERLGETFYNCINESYINNNNLSSQDFNNMIGRGQNSEYSGFEIEQSYVQESLTDQVVAFIKGKIIYKDFVRTFNFAFETDYTFFDIEPLSDESFNNIINNKVTYKLHDIKQSEYNLYWETTTSDRQKSILYLEDFVSKIKSNMKDVYDNYLSEDMKIDRFNTYESFTQYIQENIQDMSQIYLYNMSMEYSDDNDGGTRYIIDDNFGNRYTFLENAVLEYEIIGIEKISNQ